MAARKPAKMRSMVAYSMIVEGKCRSHQVPDKRKQASKNACRTYKREEG